jgi:hypothetical protein
MANPTTNYGFVLPTATDLVTDLPADFDVALQGVDTRLKALQPGTTLGDLFYASATANTNTRLPIGSTSQVLTVTGGVPAWATPAGGGKVLQVVYGSTSTATAIASTTYTDTTLTASITPSSASSKVLVLVAQVSKVTRSAIGGFGAIRLVRGATTILEPSPAKEEQIGGTIAGSVDSVLFHAVIAMNYLDSPATTSATTYKTQGATFSTGGSGTYTAQTNSSISTIILMEIGA